MRFLANEPGYAATPDSRLTVEVIAICIVK